MIGTLPYRLPAEAFVRIAGGGGGREAIRLLRRAGRSRTLLALRFLATEADRLGHPDAPLVERACRVLSEAHRHAADAVARVLGEPEVSMWAIGAARELVHGGTRFPPSSLANVAAAAAVRAGIPAELTTAPGASTHLPSLGTIARGGRGIRIRPDGDGCLVHAGGHRVRLPAGFHVPAPGWSPLVSARLGPKTITLDRWGLGSLPQPFAGDLLRVGSRQAEKWSRVLSGGIELLRRHGTAEAVIETVHTATPLRQTGPDPASATLADAFGCVLLSLPDDARAAALTLVHEVQHAKLTGLLDVLPLLETSSSPRFYAPWRQDPRPLLGLLHGAYAYVGVVGFWGRQRELDTDPERVHEAEVEFARWLAATTETVSLLAGRPEFTGPGRTVLTHMAGTLAEWSRHRVSASARAEAEALRAAHREQWARP
ncbi:aKG-HExxH-type peptide beta-hydroxylase [Amycolatopsis sp. lyj-109]|uniref:aKG-HExxH-type peptide beta-hydroxylase n=1 Tax=Amycolatopsis sp. lyj-109 TaxID=2789287 RepID=UPI003977F442